MKPCADVRLGPVASQILAYLSTHEGGQDTITGIAEWWLLEQRIQHVIIQVNQAVAELVASGLVLQRTGLDRQTHYRLNRRRRTAVARHLQTLQAQPADAPGPAPGLHRKSR